MTTLEAVPGVGPTAVKRLKEVFITTAEILSVQNPAELQTMTKLGEVTVAKIIRNAREVTRKFQFMSGIELEKHQADIPRLKFGIGSLDKKLLGGMEAGSIIELYGSARGGKTFLCHQLAVRCQLPFDRGGLEGRVLWLDTEGAFKTTHIRANAIRWGMDPDNALGNINVAPIALSSQIEDYRDQIQLMLAEGEFKMLIVDSLTGLFRAEYTGIGNLASRQYSINKLLNWMRRLGLATDAVFVYTNQVTTQITSYGGNPSAPVGGHVVSHASDYRFFTRVGAKGKRKISLKDNSGVPEFDVEVEIGWGGAYSTKSEKKATETIIFEQLGELDVQDEEEDKKKSKDKKSKKSKENPEKKEINVGIETEKEKATKTEKREVKAENKEVEEVSPEVKVGKKKKVSTEVPA
ncbi:MAG: AAA family ATPase [Candidatus Thorarchaeota archaeon]